LAVERKDDTISTAFESIKQRLQEAIAHAKGESGVHMHRPRAVDVKVCGPRRG